MSSSDQLILKNTPNSPPTKRFCWNGRPCYRELECDVCWNRKRPFLIDQFHYYGVQWGLGSFMTIAFPGLNFEPDLALQFLSEVRKKLHKNAFNGLKYISLIAIHGELKTPHFHIVVSENISKEKIKIILKRILKGFDESIKFKVNIKAITDLYGLAWYFVVENLKPSLEHRPKGLRLMSASRPFLTGKPKKIKHIKQWRMQWKEKTLSNRTTQINKKTETVL